MWEILPHFASTTSLISDNLQLLFTCGMLVKVQPIWRLCDFELLYVTINHEITGYLTNLLAKKQVLIIYLLCMLQNIYFRQSIIQRNFSSTFSIFPINVPLHFAQK